MSHIDETKLTAYALGELDATEAAQVEALLANDPAARAEVDEIRRLGAALRQELAKECVAGVSPASDATAAKSLPVSEVTTNTAPPVCASKMDGNQRRSSRRWQRWSLVVVSTIVGVVVIGLVVWPPWHRRDGIDLRGGQCITLGIPLANAPATVPASNPATIEQMKLATVAQIKQYDFQGALKTTQDILKLDPRNRWALDNSLILQQYAKLRSEAKYNDIRIREEQKQFLAVRNSEIPWSEIVQHPTTWVEIRDRVDLNEEGQGSEAYSTIVENRFLAAKLNPLSTFSIDVDTASYTNMRRYLMQNGQLPPKDVVRIEEMINYFDYAYPSVAGEHPVAAFVDVTVCPWNTKHRLARVGIVGKAINPEKRPAMSLVFLLDVSGSMGDPNKLDLVKKAMTQLVDKLTDNDSVGIVTYAGTSGVHMQAVMCDEGNRPRIKESIEQLSSGGSTNGGSGVEMAYEMAKRQFIKGGVNRVILCTDGDFNVGTTDRGALVKMIEEKAKTGVFLSVLGFGMGNLKDATLEQLADKGNGNYGYVDNETEARRQLVDRLMGTLVTVAKDVKLQIEFNPARVAGYRLIGYENRVLAAEDFNNDRKDAGEIGSGQTVTALYEIVPAGQALPEDEAAKDAKEIPLRYSPTTQPATQPAENVHGQDAQTHGRDAHATTQPATQPAVATTQPTSFPASEFGDELMAVKIRYKEPTADKSVLMQQPVKDNVLAFDKAPEDMRFAAAVAAFGMILRDSKYVGDYTLTNVHTIADNSLGADKDQKRHEFVTLVQKAQELKKSEKKPTSNE